MHKIGVKSDRLGQYKKKMDYDVMDKPEYFPVDLYGKRVTERKNDPSNLKNIAEDIQDFYDLRGDLGMKGGE